MRRIAELFSQPGKKLVPYITAGFPEKHNMPELVLAAERAGADMVEIGMPFSDPLADGPVIQRAGQRALENGITVKIILEQVRAIRRKSDIPLTLMGYINPLMKYGLEDFLRDASEAGVDGLILPDLPIEEGEAIYEEVKQHGISPIILVAPNTPDERLARIGALAKDLIYAVSILGITGSSVSDNTKLRNYLARIRKHTETPFVVGFGIKTPEDAGAIAPMTNGVVVGTALIESIETSDDPEEAVYEFLSELKAAIRKVEVV
ncbi:MAG: tryptophan synthase subunit alpha [Candidatus Marinimicrobia bacterium]|nr:tryptophan synthase subunit alpha [Candidatus Neomarinimicrobiota bacterium]MCF7828244.1 tryptophan synthase subunit alpha [Candidatus Neomarinimicrobiota bacterium]MCF7879581.1 tryptophan synthase subunit alpha [Candidatus Neomarinimicrobiota bacterium]